jgi:hypothetical protein
VVIEELLIIKLKLWVMIKKLKEEFNPMFEVINTHTRAGLGGLSEIYKKYILCFSSFFSENWIRAFLFCRSS